MNLKVLAVLALMAAPASAEPLIVDNGRLFVTVDFNGVATQALLDSGAEASLVDDDLARAAGLPVGKPIAIRGSGGEAQAKLVEGVTIRALGAALQPEAVVVMDLDGLSQRLIKRPTPMILGREMFDAARLHIDMAGGTIDRIDATGDPQGTRLQLTPHAGIESVPVIVNGVAAQAEFDLGNGSQVLVSRPFARKLGLPVTGKAQGGGIGGAVERDTVRIDSLQIAGETLRDVSAAIDDQPNANDLNIGTSVLRHFTITTDFPNRAVWLEPVAGSR